MKNRIYSKTGVSLIGVIFVMIIFSVLGIVGINLVATTWQESFNSLRSTQALFLTEAAIQYALEEQLAGNDDWSGNQDILNKSLGDGTFSIEYQAKSKDTATIKFTGKIEDVTRKIIQEFKRGWPSPFEYAIFGNTNSEPLELENAVHVDGDVYYDGDVVVENTAVIDGLVYADSVSGDGEYKEAQQPPVPEPTFPILDTSYYQNQIDKAQQQASQDLELKSENIDLNGDTLYYQNVEIRIGSTVNGPGTIVATEDVSIRNTSIINENVTIISQGDIELDNESEIKSGAVLYSISDIELDNASRVNGSILAPQPDSKVEIRNSSEVQGIIYAYGAELENSAVIRGSVILDSGQEEEIENSVAIYYDPSYLPQDIPPGMPTTVKLGEWREVLK